MVPKGSTFSTKFLASSIVIKTKTSKLPPHPYQSIWLVDVVKFQEVFLSRFDFLHAWQLGFGQNVLAGTIPLTPVAYVYYL